MRLYLAFLTFFVFFVGINIAFLDNLRRIWHFGYPILLFVINLDLLVLFLAFLVFFRKFIKTYLSGTKRPLRRKLSTSLILYIITPLIFLNVATSIILLQSTKAFVSGQLKDIGRKSQELTLLVENTLPENAKAKELVKDIHTRSQELGNMVKARDIIGGIYVYFLVLAGFVSFLSAVWFGNLVARHITIPLERLSNRAKEIAEGNFNVNVEVQKTGDEVEELAKSFEQMKERLKNLYEHLKRERDILERLFSVLPVGIYYRSFDGFELKNSAYETLRGKENIKVSVLELEGGKVEVYEDLEPVILSERFKTWQMAVKRIAHEIKNPLTPITLNLERLLRLLEKGQLEKEKAKELIKLILEESERIRQTLNYFRELSVEVEPKPEPLSLGELLKDIARLYSELEVKIEGDAVCVADKRLLRDFFLNLLNNSLEWGARKVEVSIKDGLLIYTDDGKGIQEGKEELIFLPYHSENPKGMGLGLAIVKHIAQLHGWEVRAKPDPKGFYLEVELKPRKGST